MSRMSRFLFVVPPLPGRLNPTVAVGAELAARNHDVAWVADASVVGPLVSPRSTVFATDHALAGHLRTAARRPDGLTGPGAFRELWNDLLIPFADATLPHVEAAVDRFAPHVLVVDHHAIAGALVARRRSLNWATLTTTSYDLTMLQPSGPWLSDKLSAFQIRAGIPVADQGDLRFSEQLILAFRTPPSAGSGPFPPEWRFVGPALSDAGGASAAADGLERLVVENRRRIVA